MPAGSSTQPSHHAVIAGTGRAGTSFLIKFLAACGLDIGDGLEEQWNERASAGMERSLLAPNPPYLVKDPGFGNYSSEVDPNELQLDALIVPIRDLASAATSRILQERIAKVEREGPGMMAPTQEAITPGGALTSLDPVDQSRLLAVEFHRLIHWATITGVPLFLLDFPRLVQDRSYLIDTLWPWLSQHTDRERAEAAFDTVAEPDKVRFSEGGSMTRQAMSRDLDELAELDRRALRTFFAEQQDELNFLRDRLQRAEAYGDELAHQLSLAEERLEHLSHHLESKRYRYVDRIAGLFSSGSS